MDSSRLSLFPRTFHGYTALTDNLPEDMAERRFEFSQTYKFNLRAYSIENPSYYVNPYIRQAHDLILDDCLSPYAAWAEVTGLDINKLSSIMGISQDNVRDLFEQPHRSPPPSAVLRFCMAAGVHPAHLLPGMAEPGYMYHSSVLDLMTELYRGTKKKELLDILDGREVSQADRDTCMKAFQAEGERYRYFEKKRPAAANYLTQAMKYVSLQRPKIIDGKGAGTAFSHAIGYHASDVDEALDQYMAGLNSRKKALENTVWEAAFRGSDVYKELRRYGAILYGDQAVDKSIRKISFILESFKNDEEMINFWIQDENDIVDESNLGDNWDSRLNFPVLHPDIELNARKSGMDIDVVKNEFLDLLRRYMVEREGHTELMRKLEAQNKGVQAFTNWRNSDDAERSQIEQFRNYLIIQPYLEKWEFSGSVSRYMAEKRDQKRLTYKIN